MLCSMTGFGSRQEQIPAIGKITVELRSSNHKFLEVFLHLPEGFLSWEERIKQEIEKKVRRGRVVCGINLTTIAAPQVLIDQQLLNKYLAAFQEIKKRSQLKDEPHLDTLINLPGVLSVKENPLNKETLWPHLKKVLAAALEDLSQARQKEGRALSVHLRKEAAALKKDVEKVSQRFKTVISKKASKIKNDEERAAFLKDTDITEEIERLSYHIRNFGAKIAQHSPIGKELDFIAQEMQREANTMGAKSCDSQISGWVVQLKSRVEKIREQVQNIE